MTRLFNALTPADLDPAAALDPAKLRAVPEGERKTKRIRLNWVCCPRRGGRTDNGKILAMRMALRRRKKLPPIDVAELGDGYFLLQDGYHRFAAHSLEDRRTILVNVIVEITS